MKVDLQHLEAEVPTRMQGPERKICRYPERTCLLSFVRSRGHSTESIAERALVELVRICECGELIMPVWCNQRLCI